MPLRDSLRQRLNRIGLQVTESADTDWRAGHILNEEPLLSSLVRNCEGRFFEWDFPLADEFLNDFLSFGPHVLRRAILRMLRRRRVRCDIEILHRKGAKNSDRFGADLAFSLEADGFKKLAVVQTKISDNGRAKIELNQLNAMLKSDLPTDCLFVLASERSQFDYRLKAATKVPTKPRKNSKAKNPTKTLKTEKWLPFVDWWADWLRCEVGGMTEAEFSEGVKLLSQLMRERIEPSVDEPRWWPAAWIRVSNAYESGRSDY